MPSPTRAWAALLLLGACGTSNEVTSDLCAVQASTDVAEGAPGTEVTLTGKPMSDERDTIVRVAGTEAPVLAVERSEECLSCDTCLDSAGCSACDNSCPDCNAICETCVETVRFVVPDVAAGSTEVVLQNLWGATDPIPFTVLADAGGDSGDSGYSGSRRRRARGFRFPFTF